MTRMIMTTMPHYGYLAGLGLGLRFRDYGKVDRVCLPKAIMEPAGTLLMAAHFTSTKS